MGLARTPDKTRKRERDRQHDAARREQQPWRKWYKWARWLRLREHQLQKQWRCERCLERSPELLVPATEVHHKQPHRGDERLFFDPDNLASSCKPCHDRVEQGVEARGYDTSVGDDGLPTDPRHPFNR
jgi:5-methylcytosine-specific restriction protein A